MAFSPLERVPPPEGGWLLTLEVEPELLAQATGVHVSATEVYIERADAENAVFELPADAARVMDDGQATCKLHRRRGRLVLSWPAAADGAAVRAAAGAAAGDLGPAGPAPAGPEARPPLPACAKGPRRVAAPSAPSQRASLDYSRFAAIGDDDDDDGGDVGTRGGGGASSGAAEVRPLAPSGGAAKPGAACAGKKLASIDYSRFEGVSEEDATLDASELRACWRRHVKLRRMRGEEPLDFERWCRARAKLGGTTGSDDRAAMDPRGRGLWRKTFLEDAFEELAVAEDRPADEELPKLVAPDMLSAMQSWPGANKVDATAWARRALQTELSKACSTDRAAAMEPGRVGFNGDIRVDALIGRPDNQMAVEVGDGNAVLLIHPDENQLLCGYRFTGVKVRYVVSLVERPSSGAEPTEHLYTGTVEVPELMSGVLPDVAAFTERLRTSMPDPKPRDAHRKALRPILQRLELSLAYFARRFERQLLQRAFAGEAAP